MPTPIIVVGALVAVMSIMAVSAGPAAAWATAAPEQFPPVTVRWEDPGQREVFVVEGAEYECRVATLPARILSLRVRGEDLLGPEGMGFAFEDEAGVRHAPAPEGVTPRWMTWQGQSYKPANSARARMNVWSAGPYYWDAHLLDIPLMSEAGVRALREMPDRPALANWTFDAGAEGWRALNSSVVEWSEPGALAVTLTGHDPYIEAPPLDIPGPVTVTLRMRGETGAGAAFYWYEDDEPGYSGDRVVTFSAIPDGEWRQYRVRIGVKGRLRGLRFDPPGEEGLVEVDWLRVDAADEADPPELQPGRGEVVFHAFPDQLRIELNVTPPEGAARPARALFTWPGLSGDARTAAGRPLLRWPGAALLGPAGGAADLEAGLLSAPLEGDPPGAVWVLRPVADGADAAAGFVDDLAPLPPGAVAVEEGHFGGHDARSGLYIIHASANRAAFAFEPAYKNPSRRMVTGVRLVNDGEPRSITVKCMTGVGNLEAAVLTDPAGFPLPLPAFVAKNFAGEREEPDDSAFGDSYFPLSLQADEEREFKVMHLFQDWGNHPLKQVSSIRFFHIYWHLSTGASETTCFTHNWMQHGSGIFQIPDFRPMSGEMWPAQPQRHVWQWPGFLQYNDGRVKLMYERTTFHSVSPCLARFTLHYHSSDGAATGRVEVIEVPQRDETRTFLRLRYDWHEEAQVEGDARLGFRWLNMNERQGAELLLWSDAEGVTQMAPVPEEGAPVLLAEALATDSPFVAAYARGRGEDHHSLALIRAFRARLGGRDYDRAFASAVMGSRRGDYWLTVPEETLTLRPGDFVEADVMLMPHGEPVPPEVKPERERERFGADGPGVDVSIGEKIADFPATVRAAGDVARLTLRGGFDYMPVIAEGFHGHGVPLLWREGVWQDQQVHGGDGYQVEPDGAGGYRFIFVYPTRTGQTHDLMITRADCTSGISRVHDLNGSVVLESGAEGRFTLKAPALFAPGLNRITAGSPVVEFEGVGRSVRQVPVSVELAGDEGRVEITRWDPENMEFIVAGEGLALTVGQLHPAGRYALTVDGVTREVTAEAGRLRVELPAGERRVGVQRR